MRRIKYLVLASPVLLALSVSSLVGLLEFYHISIVGNSEVIKEYHFGSEAMISHGGDEYRSV